MSRNLLLIQKLLNEIVSQTIPKAVLGILGARQWLLCSKRAVIAAKWRGVLIAQTLRQHQSNCQKI